MTSPTHPTLVHSGFDTLLVAYQGALDDEVLDTLKAAKEFAREAGEEPLITFGPGKYQCHIFETGASGGYAYRLDSGPTGIRWLVKHNSDTRQWNFFASFGSKTLLAHGYFGAKELAKSELKAMGARILEASINRIDFAMDFRVDGFLLNPEQFVGHNRSTVQTHYDEKPIDELCPTVVTRGRKVRTVTIGKMPGQQIIVYDKRHEAIQKRNLYWFKIWDIDPKDTSIDIFRIEVRAGKKLLKERYGLSIYIDIEASIGEVLYRALKQVRYIESEQWDSNVTRSKLHPLWEKATSEVLHSLEGSHNPLVENLVKEAIREEKIDMYTKQMFGSARGLAVALGMTDDQIQKQLPHMIGDKLAAYIKRDGERFYEGVDMTRKKLRFVG